MSVAAQMLRSRYPNADERIASLLPGYRPYPTYPEEIEGGSYNFSDAAGLRVFLGSSEFHNAKLQGAQITMLQIHGTMVWIKYPRGSAFYQRKFREAIAIKNIRKRKSIFFLKLGKLMLKSITTPK